ncbi:MAG: hypothetical protein U1B80_04460, partial [Anaerolineaceae bacterium]|nr:hypothetical protein [Anaerolineaceae bacterium]
MTAIAATVVALGDLNLDVMMAVAELPAKGKEAFAKQVELRPGGSAASAASLLARLGVQTRLLACCG